MNYKYVSQEDLNKIEQLLFELNNTIVDGNLPGKHKSVLIGKSLDFVQHREYVSGDDIKLIDWKVYARRDRFFIKQYQQETNLVVNFAVDCSTSMWFPEEGNFKKYEYGSFLVSYLSYILLSQGDSVGLIKFADKIEVLVPPSSRENNYYDILRCLENEVFYKGTSFEKLCNYIIETAKKRTVVIVVSDLISPDETKIVKLLRNIASAGVYVILLHLLDKTELFLNYEVDNCIFEDVENEFFYVKTNLQDIKERYKKEITKLIEYYKSSLNDKNIRYITIDTSIPIVTNLKNILIQT